MNTKSAVPSVRQGTSKTFQNPSNAQWIVEKILETLLEGLALRPSNKQSMTDQLDNIDKDDSLYEATPPPSSTGTRTTDKNKSMPNAGPTFTPALEPFVGTIDKEIAALTAEKKAVQKQ